MNFETRSSHIKIDRGGSFSSQIRAEPSRENGKSLSLIDVLGISGNLIVEGRSSEEQPPSTPLEFVYLLKVRIYQKSQENSQSQANTELENAEEYKRAKRAKASAQALAKILL
ncbi:hypothetical protein Tco_0189581 [Tanacetum coccineum]